MKLPTLVLMCQAMQRSVNLVLFQVICFLPLSSGLEGGGPPGTHPCLMVPLWSYFFSLPFVFSVVPLSTSPTWCLWFISLGSWISMLPQMPCCVSSLEHGSMSTLGLWTHGGGQILRCRGFSKQIFWGLLQMLVCLPSSITSNGLVLSSFSPDYSSHIQDTRTHNTYRNTLEIMWIWSQATATKWILPSGKSNELFHFPGHINIMFTLYCSLLNVQYHYVYKNVHSLI